MSAQQFWYSGNSVLVKLCSSETHLPLSVVSVKGILLFWFGDGSNPQLRQGNPPSPEVEVSADIPLFSLFNR